MATKRRKLVEPEATEKPEDKPLFRYKVLSTGQIYAVRKVENELWANWVNYKDGLSYIPGEPEPGPFRVSQDALDRSISFSSIEVLSD